MHLRPAMIVTSFIMCVLHLFVQKPRKFDVALTYILVMHTKSALSMWGRLEYCSGSSVPCADDTVLPRELGTKKPVCELDSLAFIYIWLNKLLFL